MIKNIKDCTKQVHMAPYELPGTPNFSYGLWEASGMPPGPWGALGGPWALGLYLPLKAVANIFNNPRQGLAHP